MKIYIDIGNINALKLLIASSENKCDSEVITVAHGEHVVPYLKTAKLPVLEVSPGKFVFSANVATSLLFPAVTEVCDQSVVESWMEWESTQFQPVCQRYMCAALSSAKPDAAPVRALLAYLQDANLKQPLVGSSLTAADVCIWVALFPLFNTTAPFKAFRDEFSAVQSWFDNLSERTSFKSAVTTVFGQNLKENMKASYLAQPAVLLPRVEKKKPAPSVSSQPSVDESPSHVALSPEEITAATETWRTGRQKVAGPRQRHHPILPQKGQRNILITSALPYVNNVPHLGNIIGCVLSADVFSRYCRLRNYNSLYVCGTDEYGTATETKAVEEGLTPQQICDKYNELHKNIYQWFNIDFDYFGRTTTQEQTKIAQDIFWDLHKNGYIMKQTVEQLKCQKCDRFLADRFVEGICPFCAYDDARGDQCDKCGKLINAVELREPRCKLCQNRPSVLSSSHLFLDLPQLEKELSDYLESQFKKGIWTHNTKVISRSWIRDGLKPRCISRDLKWGTAVPLEGYTEKVFYVWYDAPIGYISITANYTKDWERWWKNPQQVNLYNFMAKDNIPFHSMIFPSTLLGTKKPWTIVNHLSATEYLNYEDGKFSKSRGVGVFGHNAQETGIPADVFRFYLLYLRPESQDSAFSWDDFVLKNNSELLNNLGNFINRALMFVANTFKGVIPAIELNDEDGELLASINRELTVYLENMERCRLRDGIRNLLSISRLGNQYIQANKPWVLVKGTDDDKCRGGSVIGLAANIACLLSVLVQPYMPAVSQEIQSQLNAPAACNVLTERFVPFLPHGHKIGKPQPLFQKIEASVVEEIKKKFSGQHASSPAAGPAAKATQADVDRLTAQVTEQGNKVRELKAAKAEKATVTAEVTKLLDLKKQLALAQEAVKAADASPPPTAAATPSAAPTPGSPAEIARLTGEVATQGNLVRELKAAKADKAKVTAEVAKLIDLKRQLALAQGEDPNKQQQASSGGKKKKKGKK